MCHCLALRVSKKHCSEYMFHGILNGHLPDVIFTCSKAYEVYLSFLEIVPSSLILGDSYLQPRWHDRRHLPVPALPGCERERQSEMTFYIKAQVQAQLQQHQQVVIGNYKHLSMNQEILFRNQRNGAENYAKLSNHLH